MRRLYQSLIVWAPEMTALVSMMALEFASFGLPLYQCPRTNVKWISSLSESDRLEIHLTFGFRCWKAFLTTGWVKSIATLVKNIGTLVHWSSQNAFSQPLYVLRRSPFASTCSWNLFGNRRHRSSTSRLSFLSQANKSKGATYSSLIQTGVSGTFNLLAGNKRKKNFTL